MNEFERLAPLWLALHEHHVRLAPELAGMTPRSAHESWTRRRAGYLRWAIDPQTFVLVAEAHHEIAGYAFVTVNAGYSTWDSGERVAQLETLAVAPPLRRLGIGGLLLAAVRERLARTGIERIALTAAAANDGAHRFYERAGFTRAEVVFVAATAPSTDQRTKGRP